MPPGPPPRRVAALAMLVPLCAMSVSGPAQARGPGWAAGPPSVPRELQRALLARALPEAGDEVTTADGSYRIVSWNMEATIDVHTGQVELVTHAELAVQRDGLAEIYVYLYEPDGLPVGVADDEGPLPTTDTGWGTTWVQLRAPLMAGDTLALHLERTGVPTCGTSLGILTCRISPGLTFSTSLWQLSLLDLVDDAWQVPEAEQITGHVTVEDGLTVAASAVPAGSEPAGEGVTTHHFVDAQTPALSISVGPWVQATVGWGDGKDATAYVPPGAAAKAQEWAEAIADIMSFYEPLYDAYTPPVVAMSPVPDDTGAAMGPLMNVLMPESALAWGIQDPIVDVGTLAHELAHQWFGNLVVGQNMWMSESFAEFSRRQYQAARRAELGGAAVTDSLRGARQAFLQGYVYTVEQLGKDMPCATPYLEIPDWDWELVGAVFYTKASLVVAALRYLAGGDEAFYEAVRAYRSDHEGAYATEGSFRASLEAATGLDLAAFFDAWVFDQGYPVFLVDVHRQAGEEGHQVSFRATTTEPWALPVEVDLVLADGTSERHRVEPDAAGTTFELTVPTEVALTEVRFDPDNQIPGLWRSNVPGDVVLDGAVDGLDLLAMVAAVGRTPNPYAAYYAITPEFDEALDLLLDGQITQAEVDLVVDHFGERADADVEVGQ